MSSDTGPDTAAILRRLGVRPRRALGQNFLEDPTELRKVVEAADLSRRDEVLEIGTGFGSLTRHLAIVARRVVGVEVDGELAALSRQQLRGHPNVEILHADILEVSPLALGLGPGYVVVANIPYNITSPILRHLLESIPRPQRIVLTVQREVGIRICAEPPGMSVLAVSVQVHGSARLGATIPANAFHPIPKVDSAVIRIDCFDHPRVPPDKLPIFFKTVRAGFLQPRKMLRNSLAAGLHVTASDGEELLATARIDGRRRAQTLGVEEWIRLAEVVAARGW